MKNLHRSLIAAALATGGASFAFSQGALTPPGPPAPTMKTLDQVEARIIVNPSNTPGDATNAFIIRAPGSYYFTSNITGENGKHGINIQADDVTLDLNGFALISGGGGLRGVNVPGARSGFCIRNGSVRGWAGGGVRADAAVTLAEKLRLSDNTGATGLVIGNGSLVKDCVASGNGTGFFAGDRTHLNNCISTVNTGAGFNCTSYVTLLDCTSSRNGGDGIIVQANSSVTRCNSSRNIPFGGGGGGLGIRAGPGSIIADCIAGSNTGPGIFMEGGGTVSNCTTGANSTFGILAVSNSHITGNTCEANFIGGIRMEQNSNRVDGNSCIGNAFIGIVSAGNNNLIIRNSARGNGTNFDHQGSDAVGLIVNMQNGGTITSNNPWANFSY